MTDPVFKKEDFIVCNLPVPNGYPQSQTHAGVFHIKKGLMGYQYWLVSTPYPALKEGKIKIYVKAILRKIFSFPKVMVAENFENPMLYFGNNNKEGFPPVNFIPYNHNPLMEKPPDYGGKGTYCSDPDLFIYDNNIYILVRIVDRSYNIFPDNDKKPRTFIYLLAGKVKDESFFIEGKRIILSEDSISLISPSLTFFNNRFYLFTLDSNSYNDGTECKGLIIRSSNSLLKKFSNPYKISIEKGNFEPWHMSVFKYKEYLYSIVACVKKGEPGYCYQMLGKFNKTLTKLKIFQKPLTTIKSYRGAAFVREDGLFVLYSTVDGIKMKGSKSVDGRDVVMASKPFDELLRDYGLIS